MVACFSFVYPSVLMQLDENTDIVVKLHFLLLFHFPR